MPMPCTVQDLLPSLDWKQPGFPSAPLHLLFTSSLAKSQPCQLEGKRGWQTKEVWRIWIKMLLPFSPSVLWYNDSPYTNEPLKQSSEKMGGGEGHSWEWVNKICWQVNCLSEEIRTESFFFASTVELKDNFRDYLAYWENQQGFKWTIGYSAKQIVHHIESQSYRQISGLPWWNTCLYWNVMRNAAH